jgi:hypothetical protein
VSRFRGVQRLDQLRILLVDLCSYHRAFVCSGELCSVRQDRQHVPCNLSKGLCLAISLFNKRPDSIEVVLIGRGSDAASSGRETRSPGVAVPTPTTTASWTSGCCLTWPSIESGKTFSPLTRVTRSSSLYRYFQRPGIVG